MSKFRRTILAFALSGGVMLVGTQSVATAAPPPLGPCSTLEDPSGLCPPNESQYINAATWSFNGLHGGSSVDFGSGLPSSFAAYSSDGSCTADPNSNTYYQDYSVCPGVPSYGGSANPPNSDDAWFSTNQVNVSSGSLGLGTSYNTGDTKCKDYWGYVVYGNNAPASGCWISGTVEQENSVWAWPTGTTEHYMIEAKWTGTDDISGLDSTVQASSKFPPEVDVVETETPGSGFDTNVHCPNGSGGQNVDGTELSGSPSGSKITATMTGWTNYEFDVSPTEILIYVDGTLKWTLDESDSWCSGLGVGLGDGGSSSTWIPADGSGNNTLGMFMEAVMMDHTHADTSKNQTILVDWVAEES